MGKGVCKVIIIGNLGNDPESRSFQDGGMVSNISVATSESWRDKQTGQVNEVTEWHRVVLKDRGNYKLGQLAAQYLRKGSKVYIEGTLRTKKWTDKQGIDRYTTEIIASDMQMLDGKQADSGQGQQYTPPPTPGFSGRQQAPRQNQNAQQQQHAASWDDFDDTLSPF